MKALTNTVDRRKLGAREMVKGTVRDFCIG